MRKYRCNRILEDRKISRRLCAPFFFPPFAREQPRPAQGRLTARSFLLFLHAPPKIFIFEDFDRASLEFQTFSRTYSRSLQKRIDPPSLLHATRIRFQNYSSSWRTRCVRRDSNPGARNRCIPRIIVHIVSAFARRHT